MLALAISAATGCTSMPLTISDASLAASGRPMPDLRTGSDSAMRLTAWHRSVPDPQAGSSTHSTFLPDLKRRICSPMNPSSMIAPHMASASQSGMRRSPSGGR